MNLTIKILAAILLLAGFRWLYSSFLKPGDIPEAPIDKIWWDALSEEWKTILRFNQYCNQHQVDFYKVQKDYINRLNGAAEEKTTELNTPLRQLNESKKFLLSYADMYARILKDHPAPDSEGIDLGSLHRLEKIYMVSGPGDLTPLKKFPNLKVLIINYCGLDPSISLSEQVLDLEPLRKLNQLSDLHCSSPTLKSLEPIKNLSKLVYLNCSNSEVSSLAPLKKLQNLEYLAFGSKVKNATVVTRLKNLKSLHIDGCKLIPDLSKLKKITQLSIVEHEMAIVDGAYRMNDLDFLKNLAALEFLDLELTSYRGTLEKLKNHAHLKAVTLPRVSTPEMLAFKRDHRDCIIINAYEW